MEKSAGYGSKTPAISVIIPVFNAEKYLKECLDSVLGQSFSDFELILVNDGSTDGSEKLCAEYAVADARVKLINQANAGQSAARNRGVKEAKAGLLCFIDADDAVNPVLLETFYGALLASGAGIAVSERVSGENPPADFYKPVKAETVVLDINEEELLRLYSENDHMYWTPFPCLVRKEIYESFPLTEGRVMEDNAIACMWLTAAKKAVKVASPLYFYRSAPNSTMNSPFGLKKLDYLWALEEQISFYERLGYSKMLKEITGHYIYSAVRMSKKTETELKNKKLAREIIKKAVKTRKKYRDLCELGPSEERKLFKAAHPILHKIKKKLSLK